MVSTASSHPNSLPEVPDGQLVQVIMQVQQHLRKRFFNTVVAEEDLITNTSNTGSFQLQRSPRCMETTHPPYRTQLHKEGESRLVKADLVMLGKFVLAFTVRVRQGKNL